MATSPHNPTLAEIDHAHGRDHSGHLRIYGRVFFSLLVFTLIEYFYAHWFKSAFMALVLGLLTWAAIKAALVGLYFMHLKYEGRWVLAMLVPAGFLATVLVLGLVPDMALRPSAEIDEPDDRADAPPIVPAAVPPKPVPDP